MSLFEPSAQILRRGKLHRPTEFGALVKVQETEGGIVTEIGVVDGKNDAPLLGPAVEAHARVFGRPPGLVAVDRGFYSADGERRVRALGVHHAVIPKPGFRSRERIDYEASVEADEPTHPSRRVTSQRATAILSIVGNSMARCFSDLAQTSSAKRSSTSRN